jgi:hypothetical protein
MKLKLLLALFMIVAFNAVSFAGADPGMPEKNGLSPQTVQAAAPDDTSTTSGTEGEKPHKRHHKGKHHKHNKHGHKKHDEHTNSDSK